MITPEQIRGARAMLNMKRADLAKAADISAQALHSVERGASVARAPTLASIQRALEDAGAQFVGSDQLGLSCRDPYLSSLSE